MPILTFWFKNERKILYNTTEDSYALKKNSRINIYFIYLIMPFQVGGKVSVFVWTDSI